MKKTRKESSRKYNKKPAEQLALARERIEGLFKQAESMFGKDQKLSNRYVQLARKLAMKFKIRIPSKFKRRFCKYCYYYLKPGKNCIIRLKKHNIKYYCKECKKTSYFPYLKEQKQKRLKKKAF